MPTHTNQTHLLCIQAWSVSNRPEKGHRGQPHDKALYPLPIKGGAPFHQVCELQLRGEAWDHTEW